VTETKRKPLKVVQYVWINNQHVLALTSSLRGVGIDALKSQPRIKTIAALVLAGPVAPLFYRALGYRVMHIHWTSGQFRPPRPKGRLANQFFYRWFQLFLAVTRISGIKLVWTAHNFLPHEPVFNDDVTARRLLAKRCDAVIALNQENFDSIREAFAPRNLVLIQAAEPALTPSLGRAEIRAKLQIGNEQLNFSALGHVRPYKGADLFLKAVLELKSTNVFSVAGAAGSDGYSREIQDLAQQIIDSGKQIRLQLNFLADDELGNLLLATDFLVCPFRQISNSGFINLAMEMGVPMILPDLPSLGWVPKPAAIWFDSQNPIPALAVAIETAQGLSASEREAMKNAGINFMQGRDWPSYVKAHVALYQSL